MTALQTPQCRMNLNFVTLTPVPIARIVGQSSTVQAVVPLTHTTPQAKLPAYTNTVANFSKNVLNVRL